MKDPVLAPTTGAARKSIMFGSLCSDEACPVVEKMAIYFTTPLDQSMIEKQNAKKLKLKMHFGSNPTFPDVEAGKEYAFLPEKETTSFSVPVFYGNDPNPSVTFHALEGSWGPQGRGLSPFGKFTLDFSPIEMNGADELGNLIRSATEVTLVFKVTYRPSYSEER